MNTTSGAGMFHVYNFDLFTIFNFFLPEYSEIETNVCKLHNNKKPFHVNEKAARPSFLKRKQQKATSTYKLFFCLICLLSTLTTSFSDFYLQTGFQFYISIFFATFYSYVPTHQSCFLYV